MTSRYWCERATRAETALRDLHDHDDDEHVPVVDSTGDAGTCLICSACGQVWPCPVERARLVLAQIPIGETGPR